VGEKRKEKDLQAGTLFGNEMWYLIITVGCIFAYTLNL
jgi:hypothetical protein